MVLKLYTEEYMMYNIEMDENKKKKLEEIGYEIQKCCGLCDYGFFRDDYDWGTCGRHTYVHKKHKSRRQLSIHRTGLCFRFRRKVIDLGGFADFWPT